LVVVPENQQQQQKERKQQQLSWVEFIDRSWVLLYRG
jgi:hypothetical protein